MNANSARDTLREFESELAQAEAEAKVAITKVDSLRKIVEGMRAYVELSAPGGTAQLFESTVPPEVAEAVEAIANGAGNPRGREAVRLILIGSRRPMDSAALAIDAMKRGWMTHVEDVERALNAAANRLVKDGEIEKIGKLYRYPLEKLPVPQPFEPGSGG
jgi:hypothetical protein